MVYHAAQMQRARLDARGGRRADHEWTRGADSAAAAAPASAPRADTLLIASAAFLLAPVVVFAAGWLRLPAAIAVATAAAIGLAGLARRARTDQPPQAAAALAWVWSLATFWTFAAGIGGLSRQTGDYLKHNLVFHDLIVHGWPVVYGAPDAPGALLCYYVAYYLPAALAGKLLGAQAAAPVSLVWGWLGIGLAFAWVCRLGRPHGPAVLLAFTLIDGFCWLPSLRVLVQKVGALPGAANAEWWQSDGFAATLFCFAGPETQLHFQAEVAALAWAPQHTLGAWVATACVLSTLLERRSPRGLLLIHAAVALWSPFAAVGLLPFTAAAYLRDPRALVRWLDVACAAALAVPVGLYLAAHAPQQFRGVLPTVFTGTSDWLRYGLFLSLAVGVLWVAAWFVRRRFSVPAPDRWRLLGVAFLALVAVTLVYMGRHNDWVMRVSLPALFVMHVLLAAMAAELWHGAAPLRCRLGFIVLLAVSAERSVKTYVLAPLGGLTGQDGLQTTIATATLRAESLAALPSSPEYEYASQYLGSRQGLFGRYLMRDTTAPAAVP
jgi:hypothetical protein